ncbi:hypothetical protein H1R20_g8884, partial [Candolleomyces eurysporus]
MECVASFSNTGFTTNIMLPIWATILNITRGDEATIHKACENEPGVTIARNPDPDPYIRS